MQTRVLIVHLEALGAVLRATSILPSIHRKYPGAHVTWVTHGAARDLLTPNPLIDRVLTTEPKDLLALSTLAFDVGFCIDKSQTAFGVLRSARVRERFGFGVDAETGAIVPLNPEARELYQLGLDDHRKFFVNTKPETQLLIEALALGSFRRDPYVVQLRSSEEDLVRHRRAEWAHRGERIIGLNTGCSPVIPYKKLTIAAHRALVERMSRLPNVRVVLLGGPEDTVRNQQIAHGLKAVVSPTERGLRDGLASVAACDAVVTGDSLGMHMAIALEKWTVAWFGPTCAPEIDLYDRGVKVMAQVPCSPCWKRSCQREPMCYDRVDLDEIVSGVEKGLQWLTFSSKPRLSETSSLASP